jgi:hypothetical protein
MKPAVTETVLDRVSLLFLRGRTVRSLARQFGIPKSTLHYHLLKKLGKGAKQENSGSVAIVEEHLQGSYLSRNQKNQVRRWLASNLNRIIQIDATYDTPLLTTRKEQALSNAETGGMCDFRHNLRARDAA